MSSHPPVFIEIAGIPSSGKSTLTLELERALWERGHSVTVMREIASKCPLTRMKWQWQYNAWIVCHVVSETLERMHLCQNGEVIIQDRGVFDAYCIARWTGDREPIPGGSDPRAVESFALVPEWFNRADLTFMLWVDVGTAVERRGSEGQIVNPRVLPSMRDAYRRTIEEVRSTHPSKQIVEIDTTALSPSDLLMGVLDEIDSRIPHLATP